MPTFEARPLHPKTRTSTINATLRKHPALFGVPFLLIIVGASFGLRHLTETRYETRNERVTQITQNDEVKARLKNARKFDIRQEYFRHYSKHGNTKDDWDNVRVPRPEGLASWGEAPQETRKPETALIITRK